MTCAAGASTSTARCRPIRPFLLGVLVSAVMVFPGASAAAPSTGCGDVSACERRCDTGDAAACASAGVVYAQGKSRDTLRALDLFQRACEASNAEGCRRLGDLHASGSDLPADLPRARAEWQQETLKVVSASYNKVRVVVVVVVVVVASPNSAPRRPQTPLRRPRRFWSA